MNPQDTLEAPPEGTSAPETGTVAPSDRTDTDAGGEGENGGGVMRGGHDARELALRAVESRRLSRLNEKTPLQRLQAVAAQQYEIATGTRKGSTPAQQTAAAKAYLDLQAEVAALQQREESSVDLLASLQPWQRDALSLLIDVGGEEEGERLLALLRREAGKDPRGEGGGT